MPTGELPRSVTLLVDRQLVGRVSPGTRVVALGIHTTHPVWAPCWEVAGAGLHLLMWPSSCPDLYMML